MNSDAYSKIETLSKLVCKDKKNVSFTLGDLFVPNRKAIRSKLEKAGIEYETWDKKLRIDISTLGIKTFFNEQTFLGLVESSDTEGDFAILCVNDDFDDFQYYDSKEKKVFKSGRREVNDHFLSENTVYYFKFLKELRSNIADYDNETRRKIILFDSEGVRTLKYPDNPPLWKGAEHIREVCERFFEKFKQSDFEGFFKNVLADFIKITAEENMMKVVIDNLDTLITKTDKDIRLYINKFSYEKLKNEIREQKIKYLKNLRDILGKFIAQVVAVPLSISGTLFATYQVRNTFMAGFALAAFLIYSIYAIHVQLLYLREVWDIEEDTKDDFSKIKEDSGLDEKEFEKEEKKLNVKLNTAKGTIRFFVCTLIVLTLIFLIAVAALDLIQWLVVLISTISYILLIFARVYIHRRQVKYSDEDRDKSDQEDQEDKKMKKLFVTIPFID